ncbi:S1C family serine protease [Halobacillus salinarum]|uniref:S1C family serine protease n=1 Tax=Halobacillus salinarum TaxID=2932257 RepID=A0ABY4EFP0_9BACI|nr:trypsin-like peptidase domain-containing protein [Halobacillus salinarum]UOQ43284.1 S1C family serine protease [Halobacillus salinarum]
MNRSWIVSLVLTIFILGAGVAGSLYFMHTVPDKLAAEAVLDEPTEDGKGEEKVPKTKDIIFQSQKKVVQIKLDDGTIGSGFLYNKKGDIITNAHVVANHKKVTVITVDSKKLTGNVIGTSPDTDVAVVRVPGLKGKDPLPLQTEEKAELLDQVLALGSPLGLQNTVTSGEVSGLNRSFNLKPFKYENVYQISAPISPGNSGGPLIEEKTGEVIGINSAKLGKENIGFSIPIVEVLSLVKNWSETPMKSLPQFPELASGTSDQPEASSPAEEATYLVQYFYTSINQGDFVTAYSLIGSEWQSTKSYEEFRAGYNNTLSVSIDNIIADPKDDHVEVTAFITAEETKQGEVNTKKYKVKYPVGNENNQMKILLGKGEALN